MGGVRLGFDTGVLGVVDGVVEEHYLEDGKVSSSDRAAMGMTTW